MMLRNLTWNVNFVFDVHRLIRRSCANNFYFFNTLSNENTVSLFELHRPFNNSRQCSETRVRNTQTDSSIHGIPDEVNVVSPSPRQFRAGHRCPVIFLIIEIKGTGEESRGTRGVAFSAARPTPIPRVALLSLIIGAQIIIRK